MPIVSIGLAGRWRHGCGGVVETEQLALQYDWRDEAQVLARCKKAVPNQGVLYIAKMCAMTHEYAIEYIEQAPVLVLGATYGVCRVPGNKLRPPQKRLIAGKFSRLRGMKLKEAMAEFGLPYPLRKLRSTAITPNSAPVIFALRDVPPSVLSQAIPDRPGRQIAWLSALKCAKARYEGWTHAQVPGDLWEWLVANVGAQARDAVRYSGLSSDAGDLMDMARNRQWNMRWTFPEACRAHEAWAAGRARNDAQAGRAALLAKHGVTEDHEVDYSPLPNAPVYVGDERMAVPVVFTPLRSVIALADEGVAMRHCVATYAPQVLSGQSRIYSISVDGQRVATLELYGRYPHHVIQLKGVRNAQVPPNISYAVELFHRTHCRLPPVKKPANIWHRTKDWLAGDAL